MSKMFHERAGQARKELKRLLSIHNHFVSLPQNAYHGCITPPLLRDSIELMPHVLFVQCRSLNAYSRPEAPRYKVTLMTHRLAVASAIAKSVQKNLGGMTDLIQNNDRSGWDATATAGFQGSSMGEATASVHYSHSQVST